MASTYLSGTQSTPTNAKKWTISYWAKYNLTNGNWYPTFGCDYDNGDSYFGIGSGGEGRNEIGFIEYHTSATNYGQGYTTSSLRDPSAWYHIVFAYDSTQSTASDRGKTYINGVQQTNIYSTNIPQNHDSRFNMSGSVISIGRRSAGSGQYMDGLLSHFHFIDGTAYSPSDFGETDSTTGIWKPKTAPSVTYGTNGFFLKFENSGSMGTDSSGNANNFTVNGTCTQTIDTPSNVFATLNPLINFQNSSSYSNGNNTVTGGGAGSGDSPSSTLAVSSGKYYCEVKIISTDAGGEAVGIIDINKWNTYANADEWFYRYTYGYGYANANGQKYNNNSGSAYGDSYTNGDIVGIAVDLDNNYLYFSKNGVWQNSGDPTSGASGTGSAFNIDSGNYVFSFYHYYSHVLNTNFGNGYFGTTAVSSAQNPDDGIGIFEYDVPTGYRALCTKSINAEEYS